MHSFHFSSTLAPVMPSNYEQLVSCITNQSPHSSIVTHQSLIHGSKHQPVHVGMYKVTLGVFHKGPTALRQTHGDFSPLDCSVLGSCSDSCQLPLKLPRKFEYLQGGAA